MVQKAIFDEIVFNFYYYEKHKNTIDKTKKELEEKREMEKKEMEKKAKKKKAKKNEKEIVNEVEKEDLSVKDWNYISKLLEVSSNIRKLDNPEDFNQKINYTIGAFAEQMGYLKESERFYKRSLVQSGFKIFHKLDRKF